MRGEGVAVPPLVRAKGEANDAIAQDIDALDTIGGPAVHAAERGGAVGLPGEAHVARGERDPVLPHEIGAQLERRDEPAGGRRRIVGDDGEAAILERRHARREARHEVVVRVAADELLGHGRGDDPRVRVVGEHGGRLADEADDDITPRGTRGRAGLEDQERAEDEEREGPGPHAAKATVFRRTAPSRGWPGSASPGPGAGRSRRSRRSRRRSSGSRSPASRSAAGARSGR